MNDRMVVRPILAVHDMATARAFYTGLGFEVEAYDDGYAWVRHRGEEILHLATAAGLDPATNAAAVYLHVRNVDGWHAEWSDAGVPVGPLLDQPWGMREFVLRDPSGTTLRIGQNTD